MAECGGSRAGRTPSARYGAVRPRGGAAALPERRASGRPRGSGGESPRSGCVCPRPSGRDEGFKAVNFLLKAALSVAFRTFYKAPEAFDSLMWYFLLNFMIPLPDSCLSLFLLRARLSFLLSLDNMPCMSEGRCRSCSNSSSEGQPSLERSRSVLSSVKHLCLCKRWHTDLLWCVWTLICFQVDCHLKRPLLKGSMVTHFVVWVRQLLAVSVIFFLLFQDSVADHLIQHTVNCYYQLVFLSLSHKLPKKGDGNAIFWWLELL